jgi:membrane-bound metal-dependent hydrolase YbcI (DUF457 family)
VIPFTLFTSLGIKFKRALLLSFFALLPDLDVLLSVHRFYSHSAILLGFLLLLLPVFMKLKLAKYFSLAVLAYASHILLDLFTWYTPVLWPFYGQNIWLTFSLTAHVASSPTYIFQLHVHTVPTVFEKFSSLDAPIFTSTGFAIAVLLMVPILVKHSLKSLSRI